MRTLDIGMPSGSALRPYPDTGAAFASLRAEATACVACPAMRHVHALSPRNGPVPADVMCVAEAPGRLGAAITGVPLTRDMAGRRFEAFLRIAALRREEIFVTNAVLCLPLDPAGRNRRPSMAEVNACSRFLAAELALVRPRVVLALGSTALAALARIETHGADLSRDAGRALPWRGGWLVPLYHPGLRSTAHRSQAQQERDWRRVGQFVRRVLSSPRQPGGVVSGEAAGYDPSKHPSQLSGRRRACG